MTVIHEHDGEEAPLELVMPFVTVTSVGGPHDDGSYVAGWTCGRLDARLGMFAHLGVPSHVEWFAAALVPQVELIAMKNGYTVDLDDEETEHPGFRRAIFALCEAPPAVT